MFAVLPVKGKQNFPVLYLVDIVHNAALQRYKQRTLDLGILLDKKQMWLIYKNYSVTYRGYSDHAFLLKKVRGDTVGKLKDLVYLKKLSLISGEMKGLNYDVMMLIQYKC